MDRAKFIVAMLLEAKGVLLFGPMDDGTQYDSLSQLVRTKFGSETSLEQGINALISKKYSIVVPYSADTVIVFSLKPEVYTAPGSAKYVQNVFKLSPKQKYVWRTKWNDPGKHVLFGDVFKMSAEEDTFKPDTEREAQIDLYGKSPAKQAVPVNFGFTTRKRNPSIPDNGVAVLSVDNGSPAAIAGLKSGDRIVQVSFKNAVGAEYGPWYVSNAAEFSDMCRYMTPNAPVKLRYIRGDTESVALVYPEGQATEHDADMRRNKRDLAQLTVAEIAKQYQTTPDAVFRMLTRLGLNAADFKPNKT